MIIREAAVAGTFYPDHPDTLRQQVKGFLDQSCQHPFLFSSDDLPPGQAVTRDFADRIKALIVPHAGYIYSGALAAQAYNLLRERRTTITRVILLGPSHRVALTGCALPQAEAFATPLGTVPIDKAAVELLLESPLVTQRAAAHLHEHCLEVQLPFLQTVLANFTLVPLVVGRTSAEDVARLLNPFLSKETDLIVISSDLSHFHSYENAQLIDRETSELIEGRHPLLDGEQACGCHPLNGLLKLAQQEQLTIKTIGQCNSGDTAGDKSRVVGYGAYVCYR